MRRDGSLAGDGRGVPELLRATRRGRGAGLLLGRLPPSLLDRSYAALARRRERLGRLVPDGPAPRRFP